MPDEGYQLGLPQVPYYLIYAYDSRIGWKQVYRGTQPLILLSEGELYQAEYVALTGGSGLTGWFKAGITHLINYEPLSIKQRLERTIQKIFEVSERKKRKSNR